MATKSKRFKTQSAEGADEVFFELENTDGSTERFDCYPALPGAVLLDLMTPAAAASEDRAGILMAVSVLEFFPKVMPPQEFERLSPRLRDMQNVIGMTQMSEIMEWLIEVYSDRPTEQPQG